MATNAINLDPLDEFRLVARPSSDRLPAMLFLAALVHGVLIIGIAFNPALTSEFAEAISLDVTIVAETDQNIDRPDRAEYLAQASQEGGGNTREHVRPSAAQESLSPIDNAGSHDGNSFTDSTTHDRAADERLSSNDSDDRKVSDDPREEPEEAERIAMALEKGSESTLPLPRENIATLMIHDDDPRQLVISADTEESNVAQYLDTWKRRIEAVGNEYFPELGQMEGLTGSPTLEVSINATGDLAEVVIRKSSGSVIVDKAALDILRRASPFDPFPAEIRGEYDSLRFAYKWLFAEDVITKTARVDR
ncbi:MAG: TonB family protein [Gammaproteobacteria bacterium]|nr:TonB family protein [Gammaproteobacteria bacterium]